jgi:hypothetical protein
MFSETTAPWSGATSRPYVTFFGDCLRWTYFWKLQKYAEQIFGLYFQRYKLRIHFDKKWVGLHFGRVVPKLIWSPWFRKNIDTCCQRLPDTEQDLICSDVWFRHRRLFAVSRREKIRFVWLNKITSWSITTKQCTVINIWINTYFVNFLCVLSSCCFPFFYNKTFYDLKNFRTYH